MLTFRESPQIGRGEITRDGSTTQWGCTVDGTLDRAVVEALVLANRPPAVIEATGRILRPQRYVFEPAGAGDCWEATVQYSSDVPDPDWGDFHFSTGGGTHHTTHSLNTRGRYPEDAEDYQGAIGVTDQGVEGVDITSPVYTFSEAYRVPGALVTPAYKNALFRLTGRTNQSPWRGFEADEVLFLGARGATQGWEPDGEAIWEINFEFAASENRDDLMVGPIGPIVKHGWDYLWVKYDSDNKPEAVYVEQVYRQGPYLDLGIGE